MIFRLKNEFVKAMDGVLSLLVKKTKPNGLTFVGELLTGRSYSPKMVINIHYCKYAIIST